MSGRMRHPSTVDDIRATGATGVTGVTGVAEPGRLRRRGSAGRRWAGALAAATALVLIATGCTGIPDSGTVHSQTVSATPDPGNLILLPSGPVIDATQEQILNGFLQAAASPQNDYQIARQFLSKDFRSAWDPNAGVLIDSGQPSFDPTSATGMSVNITPQAEVDATGEYQENASTATVTLPFEFTQESGQWRISMASPGIVLEQLRFNQVFSSHALYFYDPTYTYLIPDVRWFAKDENAGTRVVKALLAGPAPYLGQGAVVTAFPDGTEAAPVVVNSGLANVDLSNQVLSQPQVTLQRMQAQLDMSLQSVASVASAVITVNQNPVTIAAGFAPSVDPRVDPRALVEQNATFGYLTSGSVVPIASLSDKVQALAPLSATQSSKVFAVGTAAGVYAVQPGGNDPVLVDARQGLVAPSLDPAGFLWTVPAGSPNDIQAYGSDGTKHPVTANWDGASSITSFDVSRDGTRVLAFTTTDGAPRLIVAAIIRDKDGIPLRLGDPVTLASGAGSALDATWVDESNVVSLTKTGAGLDEVVLQQIGGMSSTLGTPVNAVALAGGSDLGGLWLLTSAGDLQQQRGSGWQTTARSVAFLVTQTSTQ